MQSVVTFTILLCFIISHSDCYFLSLVPHSEECYFDRVVKGTKLTLLFEVAEGGHLDIDVKIIGPDEKVIYNGDRQSNGKYAFVANQDGIYHYCFSNKMSTVTHKIIMFSVDIKEKHNESAGTGDKTDGSQNKLEDMMQELSTSLTSVKHEQEYMEIRDKIHREINENTNHRVLMWSMFEAVVLIAMTVGQVYYLKRFFEVRRIV